MKKVFKNLNEVKEEKSLAQRYTSSQCVSNNKYITRSAYLEVKNENLEMPLR